MKFESLSHVLHYAEGMNIDVIIYKNKVVDVTEFKEQHPGGQNTMDKYIGKDCTEAFNKVTSHETKSAMKDLNCYTIGEICTDKDNNIYKEEPIDENEAFDVKKGILWQIYSSNKVTKQNYLDFMHDPKHLFNPPHAVMFDTPFLEFFSKTNWYAIPICYFPFMFWYLYLASQVFSLNTMIPLFLTGILMWTFTEYSLHRFVFHFDENLPNIRGLFVIHFLLHGIHHAFPMDR